MENWYFVMYYLKEKEKDLIKTAEMHRKYSSNKKENNQFLDLMCSFLHKLGEKIIQLSNYLARFRKVPIYKK